MLLPIMKAHVSAFNKYICFVNHEKNNLKLEQNVKIPNSLLLEHSSEMKVKKKM